MAQKTPPAWLNNQAKSYWRKLHTRCDSEELLAVLCNALAMYRQATDCVNEEGILLPTLSGGKKQNPATYVQRDAFSQIVKLRDIVSQDAPEDDELAGIFG